jgi:hypothetical protein
MEGVPPFVLLPLDDGRYELRAFSDDAADPIVLVLDESDGRRLKRAVGDALDAPHAESTPRCLIIGGREVVLTATADGGLRLTVARSTQ